MQDKQFKKMPGYAVLRRYVSWHARNFNRLQGTLVALLRNRGIRLSSWLHYKSCLAIAVDNDK